MNAFSLLGFLNFHSRFSELWEIRSLSCFAIPIYRKFVIAISPLTFFMVLSKRLMASLDDMIHCSFNDGIILDMILLVSNVTNRRVAFTDLTSISIRLVAMESSSWNLLGGSSCQWSFTKQSFKWKNKTSTCFARPFLFLYL